MPRLRSRDLVIKLNLYSGFPSETRVQDRENCVDDVGFPNDHSLSLERDTTHGNFFDWAGVSHGVGYTGTEVSRGSAENTTILSYLSPINAQKIAAMTAPERPLVNTVTNILDIRQIPQMLRHAGDLLHRIRRPHTLLEPEVVASTTLAYQFGWAPLVQDLTRMVNFGRLVDRRLKEIGALNSGKTIRKKVTFGRIVGSYGGTVPVHSKYGINISPQAHTTWSCRCWGTIHWELADMNRLGWAPSWWWGFRSVYGLSAAEIPIQIWKALPWSWAIDWFANLSDALEVSKNLITYKPSRINRMHQVVKSITYKELKPAPNRQFYGGTRVITEKYRIPLSIGTVTGIRLSVPFLDTYKLSVLSALTVVKLRGRRPQQIR